LKDDLFNIKDGDCLKKGFTLLEILVVIIIVGVLAAVALPSLFRTIEQSRAAEALHTAGIIIRSIQACSFQFNGETANCVTFDSIGMSDPSNAAGHPSSHFDYVITGGDPGGTYEITCTRTSLDNGTTTDQIVVSHDAGGPINKGGTGAFASLGPPQYI
jgi:prepilin-type N-terminal cleavage/methylation domain-containing protein